MQKFRVDISSRGAPMVLYAAQGDTKSRFFSVAMFDSGVAYSLPSGASVTVRFGAPGMPAGWYDIIQEPGGGSHPAVSVDGNVITAELAEQAVSVPGVNGVWLLVNAADGYQLASWRFDLFVEAVHGMDAPEAQEYYNVLTEQVAKTLANAQAAAASAAQAQQYAESINPVQFATATQGAKADTAVQSVNGQRGTTVTLTPATIGAADASDVLTLEEIQASTDLSGKIASASAFKKVPLSFTLNSDIYTNVIPPEIFVFGNIISINIMVNLNSIKTSGIEFKLGKINGCTMSRPIDISCSTEGALGLARCFINSYGEIFITPITTNCNRINICANFCY